MTEDTASIGRQMAKGAAWLVSMRFAIRVIGLVSMLILARLLVPADFGLVALGTMLYGLIEVMGPGRRGRLRRRRRPLQAPLGERAPRALGPHGLRAADGEGNDRDPAPRRGAQGEAADTRVRLPGTAIVDLAMDS